MVGGFEDALQAFQKEQKRNIESVSRIELPFPVLPNPSRYLCVYEESSTAVLVVTMEAPRTNFSVADEIPVLYARKSTSTEIEENGLGVSNVDESLGL